MKRDFYSRVLESAGVEKSSPVLVVCGGPYDRKVMLDYGLTDVLVTNLEHYDREVRPYEPFRWMAQDAEQLSFEDNSFDWAIVHDGLHHCGSPHKALCEMLRVARRGIVVIETRDSWLMRLAVRIGLAGEYELAPIAQSWNDSNGAYGGYRNTFIPNYVYRWTEREVVKTVNAFLPQFVHSFKFFYGLRLPVETAAMSTSTIRRALISLLGHIAWIFEKFMPRQGNRFAFAVTKRGTIQPWLRTEDGRLKPNTDYLLKRYKAERYNGNRPPAG